MTRVLLPALLTPLLSVQLLLGQQPTVPASPSQPSADKVKQPAQASKNKQPDAASGSSNGKDSANKQPAPGKRISVAEQIARLQRAIAGDKQRLEELERKLKEFNKEFAAASERFNQLDARLENGKQALQKLRAGGKQQDAQASEKSLAELRKKWKLAKERFELAIDERKLTQEQLAALRQMMAQDQQALKKLTEAPKPAAQEQQVAALSTPAAPAPAEAPVGTSPVPSAATPPSTEAAAGDMAPAEAATAASTAFKPSSAEVEAASQAASEKEQAAEAAEKSAAEVTQRLTALDKNIDLERKAMQAARRLADNSQRTLDSLQDDYQQAIASNSGDRAQSLRQRIENTQRRLRHAQTEGRDRSNRLDELQSERATILAEQMAAMRKAKLERDQAEKARQRVEELQNPFTPKNMWRWFFQHGPNLLAVLIVAAVLLWLVRLLGRRAANLIVNSSNRGSREERQNRADTLVSVFQNTATLMIYVGAILMALQEVGVPIVPLVGGAAVAGLAVAFGAQNLVKDYFYGFMILLENQYRVNDVVSIGGVSGLVECVTLRMTMLRDLEGVAHFIPHSSVTTVSNMTHGWSRAVFDIRVSYSEDVDRVMGVLMHVACQLRSDEEFGELVLADPEMLGVDSFTESAVMVKFMLKTRPLKQWAVKRELNRRIKNKFDELGIEMPYPQRTIHYRAEDGDHSERDERGDRSAQGAALAEMERSKA